jgi:hypothetical protein
MWPSSIENRQPRRALAVRQHFEAAEQRYGLNLETGVFLAAARNALVAVRRTGHDNDVVNKESEDLNDEPPSVKNPEINKRYWVQCDGYRCLAIMDNAGKWETFSTGKEVTGVIKVHPA